MLMRDEPALTGDHDPWAPNSEGTPDPIKETLLSLWLPLALSEILLIILILIFIFLLPLCHRQIMKGNG